jgi:hypothetical protein
VLGQIEPILKANRRFSSVDSKYCHNKRESLHVYIIYKPNPNWDKTIEPSLSHFADQEHYMMYKDKLEKKFGEGQGIIQWMRMQCDAQYSKCF